MKKVFALAFVVVICSVYLIFHLRKSPYQGHSKFLTVNVLTAEKSSSYKKKHAYLGQIEPVKCTNLAFEIAGTVKDIFVDEGAYVKENQTLAVVDMDRLVAKRDEAEAESSRVESIAELRRLTKERTVAASKFKGVSDADVDEAEKMHAAQLSHHRASEARLEQVDVEIGKAHIFAPYSGYISKRYIDEGTVVSAGGPILQIVDISRVKARIGIGSLRNLSLNLGDRVVIECCGYSHDAEVTAILPLRDHVTRNREILCTLPNQNKTLIPGDAAILQIESTIDQEGIWLPLSALTESSRGLWACYVAKESLEEAGVYLLFTQELEVIDQTKDRVFVRGILRDGDLVVSDGLNRVIPGLPVYVNKGP